MLTVILSEPIWPYLAKVLDWLPAQRNHAVDLDPETRAGINILLVTNFASIVEGACEASLRAAVDTGHSAIHALGSDSADKRLAAFSFANRLHDFLHAVIGSRRGFFELSELLRTVAGVDVRRVLSQDEWEDVQALFWFRNCVAHGRMAIHSRSGWPQTDGQGRFIQGTWEEEKFPGYGTVEQYLRKRGLLTANQTFVEESDLTRAAGGADAPPSSLFSDAISDHFARVCRQFVAKFSVATDKQRETPEPRTPSPRGDGPPKR